MLRVFQLTTFAVGVLAVVLIVVGLAVPGWLVYLMEIDNEFSGIFSDQGMQTNNSESETQRTEMKITASFSLWNVRYCLDYPGTQMCGTKTFGELSYEGADAGETNYLLRLFFFVAQ